MQVELQNIDELNATLTVKIAKEDYEKKYRSSLEEYRRKAQFKGFRKGKTPLGYIRKLYGQSVLADTINDLLQKTVIDHLSQEKVQFLGQPLPAEDQQPMDFDTRDLRDYEFKFELGLAPEFELTGLDQTVSRHDVTIPDEMVEKEWENYRRRLGNMVDVDDVQEDDVLYVRAQELDGDAIREDGWEASFAIKVAELGDETIKNQVLKQKPGDTFDFDINNLESGRDAAHVRKYHLGIDADTDQEISDRFRAEIERIQRVELAEVDQELLDKVFGEGKVTSEEEAKEKVREDIKRHYDRQADAIMYKEMQKLLMDVHDIDLPEGFLQRWLDSRREEGDPEPTEKDREDFLLDLKWQLIKEKIAEANELEVTEEDIREGAVRMVYQYVGPYTDPANVQQLVQTVLQNRDQVERISREAMAEKIFDVLKGTFNIENQAIELEAFEEEAEKTLKR